MRFYKVSQSEIKFAHIDVAMEFDDATVKSEVREQLAELEQEKCKLLAEIGALAVGQTITTSEEKIHLREPIVMPMEMPISDAFSKQPEITDQPSVSVDDEQRRQQEEIAKRRQINMGV